ncbi:hypothetical protein BGX30_007428 [Mortierella sp. GBA39]|nr:hypothetical protein BGX30_007428 [Mortierella sp. GBA39]
MPLLDFLQDGSMSQSLPAMKFYAAVLHKEYDWLQSYTRPWELMESVEATAGYEKEQFQACLRIAFLQPGVIEAFISQKDCDVIVKHKLLTPEPEPSRGLGQWVEVVRITEPRLMVGCSDPVRPERS